MIFVAPLLQAEANPTLEREIGLHIQKLRFKEFFIHNQRRRLVSEIKNFDEQLKDLSDELKKYERIADHRELFRGLRDHYQRYTKQ